MASRINIEEKPEEKSHRCIKKIFTYKLSILYWIVVILNKQFQVAKEWDY